jgi:hypothetical protein
MKKEEADQLKKLIDSFTESSAEVVEEAPQVDEPRKAITEDELKLAFRNDVPEGFTVGKADVVRSSITGDRVFLRFDGERRWIPDLDTLTAFGWDLGDVQDIAEEEMKELKEGFGLLQSSLW